MKTNRPTMVTKFRRIGLLLLLVGGIQFIPQWPNGDSGPGFWGMEQVLAKKGSGKDDDIEDKVAEDAEERLAKQLEDQMEKAAKAEERLAKEIEDQIERQLKAEEDVQKAMEDAVEEQLKAEEDLAKALEDQLEQRAKSEEELAKEIAEAAEEAAEAAEDLLEEQMRLVEEQGEEDNSGQGSHRDEDDDDNRGRGRGRSNDDVNQGNNRSVFAVEEVLDNGGNRALRDDVMVMVRPDQIAALSASGVNIVSQENLSSLDLVLVKINLAENDDINAITQVVTENVDTASVDYNHLYTLNGSTANNTRTVSEQSFSPALYATQLGFRAPLPTAIQIGTVDSSINRGHSCLRNTHITEKIFAPDSKNLPQDHGTAVASILLGDSGCATPGLLKNSHLYNGAIFFTDSSGGVSATVENVIQALNWLNDQNVKIINMSFSGPPNVLLQRVVENLHMQGTLIVAAAGNNGPNGALRYPAAYQQVVAVTAIGADGKVYRRAAQGKHIMFAAPGVDIKVAAMEAWSTQSGTSMAAPFVTALFSNAYSQGNQKQLIEQFIEKAMDLGEPGVDPIFGFGLIQHLSQNKNDLKNIPRVRE